MILYHGTNADFGEIDLAKSKPNKDSGQGFYLSREYTQAIFWYRTCHQNSQTAMNEKEQMKFDMVKNLAIMLIADNPNLSMEQALSTVLNSDTYQRLLRDATGLFHQSSGYVYSFLDNELKTGSVK